jgi:hypothetical protein
MPESDLPKEGKLGRIGAYIMVASIVICLPIALFYAYKTDLPQSTVVMAVAGIGSIGCLLGGVLMKNSTYTLSAFGKFLDWITSSSTNFWISGLRLFAWIVFFVIIIVSFVYGRMFDGTIGILIVLAGFIIAFLSIAGIMVYLGMAKDLIAIRKNLCKSDKNSEGNIR